MRDLGLIPSPKRVLFRRGTTRATPATHRIVTGLKTPEAYRLTIQKSGVLLEAETEPGLFYARQTLKQLHDRFGRALPCLQNVDWPDFPVRGFYHDVTRGKVPTLRTLLDLAETCARFKLNHLELYIEHTYAFRNHPEVWKNADPLTRSEILALDRRCAELHIDLVPSFSTFGHMYGFVRDKFPEMNELGPGPAREPFCWRDRMQHFTLDSQNPRSIALVREIIAEVRPLFRSRYFNICADETFDLGNGINRKLREKVGKGRLYVDFLNQIMAAVREQNAIPLFWGDVIANHPEVMPEIGTDAIALDWDYHDRPNGRCAKLLQKHRRTFYTCPGTSSWEGWLPDFGKGHKNIVRFAKIGKVHGAIGLLNTDWGDFGHINTLGPVVAGLALGAACGWNLRSSAVSPKPFGKAVSEVVFGDGSGRLYELLSKYASLRRGSWLMICCAFQPHTQNYPEDWFDPSSGLPRNFFAHPPRVYKETLRQMRRLAPRIERLLARCRPKDRLIVAELRIGLLGHQLMEEIYLDLHHRARGGPCLVQPKELARRIESLLRQIRTVWKKRNKPSEFYRIEEVLRAIHRDVHEQKNRT